jgi:hypothetical protein
MQVIGAQLNNREPHAIGVLGDLAATRKGKLECREFPH